MGMEVEFKKLETANLIVGCIYKGGTVSDISAEPFHKLFPKCGNAGGFRATLRVTTSKRDKKNNSETDLTMSEEDKAANNLKKYAYVVLYTSMEEPEWPDVFDESTGVFTYFGDNREPGRELLSTIKSGNKILKDTFTLLHDSQRRKFIPPFFVFKKTGVGRDVVFVGLAVPGNENLSRDKELIEVNYNGIHNYKASFSILNTKMISRKWLDSLIEAIPDDGYSNEWTPDEWKKFVESGVDEIATLKEYNDGYTQRKKNRILDVDNKVSEDRLETIDEEKRKKGGSNILLYGVPGSGKSWTIQEEYCKDENYIERVVFHPDYMYSDFVGQILPSVNNVNDGVKYKFVPGPFAKIMKKAYENPTEMYYLVIEEINRGNASAIFGDIFQLLDRLNEDGDIYKKGASYYSITNEDIAEVMYGKLNREQKIRIPSNLTILATMNSSDQNVFTLDTAFQRRWIMRMIPNTFYDGHALMGVEILDTQVTWKHFCETINNLIIIRNNSISSEDKRLGTYFITKDDLTFKDENSFNDKIYAKHHNSQFAEKVLKYLWDDAFKYSRSEIFDMQRFNTLEMIVEYFSNQNGEKRFCVFNEELRKELVKGVNG